MMKMFKKIIIILLLVIIAFLACWQCDTNPFLYKQTYIKTDSSVFIYIAKSMQDGILPYKDIFDHKGPLLYLINYIGLLVNNNYAGIWIIEVIFMLINLIFMYKISKLFLKSDILSIIAIIIVNLSFVTYFQGGNFTEEYALPFIIISLYYMIKYIVQNKMLSKKESFIIGICMSCVLLLRPNMISVFIIYCPIIFFDMLKNKKYNDAKYTVIYFILGVFATLGLCILILHIKGILLDCFKQYIIFNFTYISSGSSNLKNCLKAFYINSNISILTIIICIFIILYRAIKKNKSLMLPVSYLLYILLTVFLIILPGNVYLHYELILIPTLLVPILIVLQSIENKKDILLSILYFSIFIFIIFLSSIKNIIYIYKIYTNSDTDTIHMNKYIAEIIEDNSDENDNIMVVGNNCSIYLESNRKSSSKYIYQYPIMQIDYEIKKQVKRDLIYSNAKLIIYDKNIVDTKINSDIKEIIQLLINKNIYDRVDEINSYIILKRKVENE